MVDSGIATEIDDAIKAERRRVTAALLDVLGSFSTMNRQILGIVDSFVRRSVNSVEEQAIGATASTPEDAVFAVRERTLEHFDHARRGDSLPRDLVDAVREMLQGR